MKVVVIEDEELTAQDLVAILESLSKEIEILAVLESVSDCKDFFSSFPKVDLIFSDIQLGDGLSFDFFSETKITCPIIFCTAFDEYALKAFKTNAIDYVLKPFNKIKIAESIDKYYALTGASRQSNLPDYEVLLKILKTKTSSSSLLVYSGDKIYPVAHSDISLLYIKNEILHLRTFDGKIHLVNKTMDEMESILGEEFYRANRQYILHRNSIQEVGQDFARKLLVKLKFQFEEQIQISKAKASDFLKWLEG